MRTLRSTPGRMATAVIGVPLLLASIGWTGLTVVGLLARTSANHSATYQWAGGVINLQSADGNVTVRRGASTSAVAVSYREHFSFQQPTFTGVSSSAGLTLTGTCPGGVLGQNCSIDYTLLVPANASLDLRIGDGNVTLDSVEGDVTIHAGDGRIRGTALVTKNVTAALGDGSVALQWRLAPQRVDVSMGDGSIGVTVPAGSGPYAVTADRGDGHTDVTVPVDATAPRSMRLRMGDGSISVH